MLKLQQRACSHRDITIRFRNNERFLNKSFMYAFLVALAMHFLGMGLISVDSMKVKALVHHTAVAIEADMGIPLDVKGTTAKLKVDEQGLLPRYILEPEMAIPSLPQLPQIVLDSRTQNVKIPTIFKEQFTQLERVPYVSPIESLSFVYGRVPVKVRVFGDLAQRRVFLQKAQIPTPYFEQMLPVGEKIVKIEIHVDDSRGEVFWFEVKQSSYNDKLDKFALEVVSHMLFNRKKSSFVTKGEVEVVLNFSHGGAVNQHVVSP